jgi:dihydropyrimidinase
MTKMLSGRRGRMADFRDIWEVLKVLAQAGGIAAIHAEDNDIVMHMYEKLTGEDRTGFENMAEVHNTLSEDLSFNRMIATDEICCPLRIKLQGRRIDDTQAAMPGSSRGCH